MRSLCFVLASFGIALGCGGTTKDPVASGEAGQSSAGFSGAEASTGGSGASSAGGGSAGEALGGMSSGVAGSSGQPGEPSAAGASGSGAAGEGGAAALVDCDPKKVTCKRAAPTCDAFHVPSVEGSCYGECVKIDRCACTGPSQCPDNNQYTCWSKQHCGPYVN